MKHLGERILALGMALCLCLSLCAVPAKATDTGEMPVGEISLSLRLTRSNDGYKVVYTAKTTVVDWLAQAATLNKDDPKMADLRFTCKLHDTLTEKLGSVSDDGYTVDIDIAKYKNEEILIPDASNAAMVSDGWVTLRYKFNPAVLSAWKGDTAANVKTALQQQMRITATKDVPVAILEGIDSTIHTTAQIDITMTEGNIPFYGDTSIVAACGECSTNNPEYSVGGGGSGGGSTPSTPSTPTTVEVVDNTPSTNDPSTGEPIPSDIPVGGGTTTVENPDAKPGEDVHIKTESDKGSMVNYITVKDENGKRIPVTYDGEGKFSFEMPESGNVTVEANYRTIPADPKETGVSELLDTDHHILYMAGDDKGNFRPNANITRAEVATAFFRLLRNQDVALTTHFNDVELTDWYVLPVETLTSLHIIEGVGNGAFEPNRAITRAEFAAIAARFANELTTGASFTDVNENEWYASYVSTAANFGWINGVGNGMYEPDRPITRTEAAAIINRMLMRISDWIKIDAGIGRHFPDVSEDFWGRYEISEATNGHDHTLEEEYFHEEWIAEDWHEAVDNDPVNFGQPKH